MTQVREMAVAGSFYPYDASDLKGMIHDLLGQTAGESTSAPKALVVPHAGYLYSGPIAAAAYGRLHAYREQYTRVVLLGPSHRVPFHGLATSNARVFRTPLGDVPLDREALETANLEELPAFDEAHRLEHSLEVQLPFLQVMLDSFSLVPIVAGDCGPEAVARVIDTFWGGAETLIVISTDLSHYLSPPQARARDRTTCKAIEQFDAQSIGHGDACGATPLGGLLIVARQRGLRVRTLDLRNSGDTAGGRGPVVGYGAWAFFSH